jgi:hypothetical protein
VKRRQGALRKIDNNAFVVCVIGGERGVPEVLSTHKSAACAPSWSMQKICRRHVERRRSYLLRRIISPNSDGR